MGIKTFLLMTLEIGFRQPFQTDFQFSTFSLYAFSHSWHTKAESIIPATLLGRGDNRESWKFLVILECKLLPPFVEMLVCALRLLITRLSTMLCSTSRISCASSTESVDTISIKTTASFFCKFRISDVEGVKRVRYWITNQFLPDWV